MIENSVFELTAAKVVAGSLLMLEYITTRAHAARIAQEDDDA